MLRDRSTYRATRRQAFLAQRRVTPGVQFERLSGALKPFRRITELIHDYNHFALAKDHAKMVIVQADIAAYKSRGHGHKPTMCRKAGGAWSRDRSRYMPAVEDRKHAHG